MKPFFTYAAIVMAVFCGAFFLFWVNAHAPQQGSGFSEVHIGGKTVRVDVADTPEKRTEGLSDRAGLAPDEGMLFVFPGDGLHAFWMKDMLFSIDIVWLSEGGVVVDIASAVSPDTYPSSFSPTTPARYVLELPAGFMEEYSVQKGDTIQIR